MTDDDRLRDLLDRFADGDAVDWNRVRGAEATLLDGLHTLDAVRSAYRRIGGSEELHERSLFQWGPLAAIEKIGSGTSAEVYRAWDSGLATMVALKLLRPEAAAAGLGNAEFLHEGRMLARISQRNVLRVYGAAVHDGRPGIWNEWVEGRALDAIVAADGPLGAEEAAHIGGELCAGLAAIHAAGLLHGDVKASNAMRARGGRIVLTDLGAAGKPDAINASLCTQATPAYLSPQARDGAPRAQGDDLYALGVLLHFLLTGAYPENGASRLRELRPDIDRNLATVVERALDARSAHRYADAHAFADALRASRGEASARTKMPRRRAIAATLAIVVAALAGLGWWNLRAAPWKPEIELVRRTDAGTEPLRDGARLGIGDRVDLMLSTNHAAWVYVLNEDARGDFHVLFPLAGLALSNPLSVGDAITLPGHQGTRSLSWEVSSAGGREEFLVLVSRAPLARLDQRLAPLPAASIGEVERGLTRTRANPPAELSLRGAHLNEVLAELDEDLADPLRVRVRAWRFNDATAD